MTTVLIAVFFYLVSTTVLIARLRRVDGPGRLWLLPAVAAVAMHAVAHVFAWRTTGGLDMHFFAALSLVSLGMAALTTLYGAIDRMAALGVIAFPIAAAALLGYDAYGHVLPGSLDWRLQLHAWCALLAYATLAVAALLAILLWLQERGLRRRDIHGWLRALPPLTELELLLFRTIAVGFVLLTATLLTG